MEEKFLDDFIDAPTYNSMKRRAQQKVAGYKAEIEGIKNMKKDIEEYLVLGISFLHGPDQFYKNGDAKMKKKIAGSIFPKKLVFTGKSCRTTFVDELISLILSKHKPFRRLKIKNPRLKDGESSKAPPLGLEPRTL